MQRHETAYENDISGGALLATERHEEERNGVKERKKLARGRHGVAHVKKT